MFKKGFIFFFSLMIIMACSSDDSDDNLPVLVDNFDRASMLTFAADQIIMPSYNDFANKMIDLKNAGLTFTNSPSQGTLDALRASWYDAYKKWQHVEMFNIGKAEELQYSYYMNIYPLTVSDVENNITNGNYDLNNVNNQDAQGFPALDYLLFGLSENDSELISKYASDPNASGYILYLTNILNRMDSLTQEVLNDWNGSYRNTFINNTGNSATSSLNKLVNDFIFYYEKGLRANKVGIPAGVFSANPFPEKVEAFYKKDISKELLLESLSAVENFFNGKKYLGSTYGESFSTYLNYLERNDITEGINNQFDYARTEINSLNNNFAEQISNDNTKMTMAYDELQRAVVYLKTDMLQAFSVNVDYYDADGD